MDHHDDKSARGATRSWSHLLRAELDTAATGEADAMQAFQSIRTTFHNELARAVEPRLNRWLEQMPCRSLGECRAVASECNRLLHELGLAIQDPDSGRAGVLIADVRSDAQDPPRFRLQLRDEAGWAEKTGVWKQLPHLKLRPAPSSHAGYPRGRER